MLYEFNGFFENVLVVCFFLKHIIIITIQRMKKILLYFSKAIYAAKKKNLEPITPSYPQFGAGGGTQVITNTKITEFTLGELN